MEQNNNYLYLEHYKERVKMKALIKFNEQGGLWLPDLQKYFHATQTSIIMKWTKDNTNATWFKIEKELVQLSMKILPFKEKKRQYTIERTK